MALWCLTSEPYTWTPAPCTSVTCLLTCMLCRLVTSHSCSCVPDSHYHCSLCFSIIDVRITGALGSAVCIQRALQERPLLHLESVIGLPLNQNALLELLKECFWLHPKIEEVGSESLESPVGCLNSLNLDPCSLARARVGAFTFSSASYCRRPGSYFSIFFYTFSV